MNYSFNLDWQELPQELRDEKILAYITSNREEYAQRYVEDKYPELEDEAKDEKADDVSPEEIYEDENFYQDAESDIEARFPMYF